MHLTEINCAPLHQQGHRLDLHPQCHAGLQLKAVQGAMRNPRQQRCAVGQQAHLDLSAGQCIPCQQGGGQ